MALIGDGNGATCAAGGKSQVAGTLVCVSVGPANGACGGSLLRGRLGAPAGAPHAVRAQVLVQQAAPALAAPDPCARTCSTLYTLLRTVVNCPRDRCVAFPCLFFARQTAHARTRFPRMRAHARFLTAQDPCFEMVCFGIWNAIKYLKISRFLVEIIRGNELSKWSYI